MEKWQCFVCLFKASQIMFFMWEKSDLWQNLGGRYKDPHFYFYRLSDKTKEPRKKKPMYTNVQLFGRGLNEDHLTVIQMYHQTRLRTRHDSSLYWLFHQFTCFLERSNENWTQLQIRHKQCQNTNINHSVKQDEEESHPHSVIRLAS